MIAYLASIHAPAWTLSIIDIRPGRAEAERKVFADVQKIEAIWNARQAGGRALWFDPTIAAAIAPSCPGWGASARHVVRSGRLTRACSIGTLRARSPA
jgi:hypothetical protein